MTDIAKKICTWCDKPIQGFHSDGDFTKDMNPYPDGNTFSRKEGEDYHSDCIDLMKLAGEAVENDRS